MLELSANLRQSIGRKNNKLRAQGLVPAILYGHKVENISLIVKSSDFEKIYNESGMSTLIKLKITDKDSKVENKVVLIYDTDKNPLNGYPTHIDFYQVKMDEPISVEVPLSFMGESSAVERNGGFLVKALQNLVIEALPAELPHEIQVDISSLNTFDDRIHIKDLQVPVGVKIIANIEDIVVSVLPPRTSEELAELETTPEAKLEDIKTEKEEKAKEKTETAEE